MVQNSRNLYQLSHSAYAFLFSQYEDVGNAGIVKTEEGVVVIDTDIRTVDELFVTLPTITNKEVKFLINSHHAFDHTSANCEFARRGVSIIGSQKCREAMVRDGEFNFKRQSDRKPYIKKILEEKAIRVVPPHITFSKQLQLNLGEEIIELYYYGHGHSPGDIVIYLPKDQILFGGDLLWTGFFPNVREANVPNHIKAVDRILEFSVKYYIPGHGHITSDRNEIVRMRDFLDILYKGIRNMVEEGGIDPERIKTFESSMTKDHESWRGKNFLTTAIEVIYRSLTGLSLPKT